MDRVADRVADDGAGPGVQDYRDIGESSFESDVGDVGKPELVRAVDRQLPGPIWKNRLVMITVGGGDIASASARLKIVFAHQPSDFLVVDGHASMPQLGANTPSCGIEAWPSTTRKS